MIKLKCVTIEVLFDTDYCVRGDALLLIRLLALICYDFYLLIKEVVLINSKQRRRISQLASYVQLLLHLN